MEPKKPTICAPNTPGLPPKPGIGISWPDPLFTNPGLASGGRHAGDDSKIPSARLAFPAESTIHFPRSPEKLPPKPGIVWRSGRSASPEARYAAKRRGRLAIASASGVGRHLLLLTTANLIPHLICQYVRTQCLPPGSELRRHARCRSCTRYALHPHTWLPRRTDTRRARALL
jgi:hypothetical protein